MIKNIEMLDQSCIKLVKTQVAFSQEIICKKINATLAKRNKTAYNLFKIYNREYKIICANNEIKHLILNKYINK